MQLTLLFLCISGDPVLLAKYMKENNLSVDDVNGMCRDDLVKCAEYCHTKSSGVSTVS